MNVMLSMSAQQYPEFTGKQTKLSIFFKKRKLNQTFIENNNNNHKIIKANVIQIQFTFFKLITVKVIAIAIHR